MAAKSTATLEPGARARVGGGPEVEADAGPGAEVLQCCASVLSAPLGTDEAEQLARGFQALGDPVRLRLLSMLAAAPAGEICVCEFIGPLGKSQGTISHHLKILSAAGLVHGDRRGKWVWYSLDGERLAALKGAIER